MAGHVLAEMLDGRLGLIEDVRSEIHPVMQRLGMRLEDYRIEPEAEDQESMYEKHNYWALSCRFEEGPYTMLSIKAMTELTDNAFKGLVHREAAGLMFNTQTAESLGPYNLREFSRSNPIEREMRILRFMEDEEPAALAYSGPSFYEQGNGDFLYGVPDTVSFFQDFLTRLRQEYPAMAAEVLRNLQFRGQLDLS